jgi:uncharacterized membrane protein
VRSIKGTWPWWRIVLTGLNSLALVLAAIMSWHSLSGGSMFGCGGGSPCEQVLNSHWSMIAGLFPVSGLAMGVYLAVLVASFFIGPDTEAPIRRLSWHVMLVLTGSIVGSAIWFTILQKWIIGDYCPYCLAVHLTGLLLAALVIWQAMKESGYNITKSLNRPLRIIGLALGGMILAGALAAFQIIMSPGVIYTGGESQESLPAIDYHTVPLTGSPDAPYIVTLLFDYQCSHCQKLHFMLDEVIRRYNGKLAFALCPAPLNAGCNPYISPNSDAFRNSCELARIGLAVWKADHDVFPGFENWMFTYDTGDSWHPRTLEGTRAKAVELVGQPEFDAAMSDPWIGKYLDTSVKIYGQTIRNGKGGIPKLIFGSSWVIPVPENADDLVMILHKSLNLPLP